jgi:signal peptidase I
MEECIKAEIFHCNLDVKGIAKIKVEGNCMAPIIKHGDYVIVQKRDYHDYQVGDIVICGIYKLVAHRIVKKVYQSENVQYITKGDNENALDPIRNQSAIKGKIMYAYNDEIHYQNIYGTKVENLLIAKLSYQSFILSSSLQY